MNRFGKYKETDSMSDLICQHYPTLLVMSRFGIGLGFGDRNIGEVCREAGVDTPTFLTVINMLLDDQNVNVAEADVSVEALMDYLHNSHDYFLGYRLPSIRRELVAVVGNRSDLAKAVINYFDEYIAQVSEHMMYEEEHVFPYVRLLLRGERDRAYSIDVFRKRHDQVEARLTEFKHIMIRYYPAQSTNEINNILFDIFSCEKDLASHNAIEDRLFVPLIAALEKNSKK